jgi:S-adenosyl methyltransferase
MTAEDRPLIDTTGAHPARRYNYLLGGKDHFQADRDSADDIEKVYPNVKTAAVENRRFMHYIVHRLATEAGVSQFIDIGVALPVAPNVHEIAQRIIPSARILYVDNDPLVMTHARALLTSTPEGVTAYAESDLCDPEQILDAARTLLDFARPIAVLLLAVLHFIPDDRHPERAVAALMDAMPSGSYLVLTHGTGDFMSTTQNAAFGAMPRNTHGNFAGRPRREIERFFKNLDMVSPGLIPTSDWPSAAPGRRPEECAAYAGIAVKS